MPYSKEWANVVGLIAGGASPAAIAAAAIEAAQKGLDLAQNDTGLSYTMWLMTKLALAARQPEFGEALSDAGVLTPSQPSLFDLVGGFSDAIDDHLARAGGRTDIGEMAQMAAVESLTSLVGNRSTSLFGTTPEEVKAAVRQFSTEHGFQTLAHDFFSRFVQRFLTYHLGRELPNHVGGNGRFANPQEHNEFVERLNLHSRKVALIVREFSGGWYSKAEFEGGISQVKARNFVNYALTKLQRVLKLQEPEDG